MIKLYRLKYNLPTFWAGDICLLDDDGCLYWIGNENKEIADKERKLHWKDRVMMYHRRTLEAFKVLDTYFEELCIDGRFYPFENCKYYYLTDTGVDWTIWQETDEDHLRKRMNNCFISEEDAQKRWKKMENLVKIKNFGFFMDTYTVDKDGRIVITGKYNPEYFEKIKPVLREMLG